MSAHPVSYDYQDGKLTQMHHHSITGPPYRLYVLQGSLEEYDRMRGLMSGPETRALQSVAATAAAAQNSHVTYLH